MDKLQWFKFMPTDWVMGKIQRCPEVTQARFMRLICLYWNKECVLSYEDAEIEIDKEHLEILLSKKIIKVEDDFLVIDFLNEQFEKIRIKSRTNAENGKKGGRPPELKNKIGNTTLYVVRLYDENESFIKVGITSNSISRRMGNIPYSYEVIYSDVFSLYESINIENILSSCKKHIPLKKFGGSLECYLDELEVLKNLNNYLHNPKQSEIKANVLQNDTEKRKSREEKDNIIIENEVLSKNEIFKKQCLESEEWIEIVCMKNKIPKDKIQFALKDFNEHLITSGETKLNISDYKTHFTNWSRKIKSLR